MKKGFPPLLLALTLALTACGASAETLNNRGNEAFGNQEYEAALAAYQESLAESPELAEPHYNAANVHYRREDYDQSQREIEQTLIKDEGKLTQNSLYNLGNTFFQKEEFETAIESYKEALRLNPTDVEAKENLELALRQMEQQQQEQQQEEEQQNNQQQNGGQEEQEQDQEQQQDNQENDQQQDEGQHGQEQQSEDQQDQEQQSDQPGDQQEQSGQQPEQGDQQNEQPSTGQPGEQQQEGQPSGQTQQIEGLSQDQARQLFEAATQDTESLEEHLQQILVAPGPPPAEDW